MSNIVRDALKTYSQYEIFKEKIILLVKISSFTMKMFKMNHLYNLLITLIVLSMLIDH